METKSYPIEKRRILAELAEHNNKEFLGFFDGIAGAERRQILSKKILPPFNRGGFRKLEMRIKQQARLLVQKMARKKEIENPSSRDWVAFENVWRLWIQSKPELNKVLLDFDNKTDFDENQNCVKPPNSDLDLKCFEILLEANRKLQINQETIRRFYQFGYFVEDKQIQDLIDKALTEKEIDQKQWLAALPDKLKELAQTIADFESRISAVESANELKQELNKQITDLSKSFGTDLQQLDLEITEKCKLLDTKISKIESSSIKTYELSKQVTPLKSQLSELKKSLNTLEDKRQTTESPRIAYQAVEIGENAASLVKNRKKQKNEKDYLQEFRIPLWLLGIIDPMDSSEAKAIHVALKAFSVIEIPDPRIIDAWKAACGNNLHITTLDVGMGWLDSQDWFPKFFSEICFGEQLRQMDLDVSVEEMINKGNILWAIHLNNCDRSYPECYLPRFLKWLGERKVFVKVFLTRCLSENCCKTSFEVYNEVGQLPKPTKMMSIKPTTLPDTDTIVDKSVWGKWCQSVDEKLYQTEFQFLDKLQSEIENIPLSLLQDIQSYLLLSHQTFDDSVKALDWALYLRLYPWLADRTEIEDTLYNLIKQSDFELPRTVDALQGNL